MCVCGVVRFHPSNTTGSTLDTNPPPDNTGGVSNLGHQRLIYRQVPAEGTNFFEFQHTFAEVLPALGHEMMAEPKSLMI